MTSTTVLEASVAIDDLVEHWCATLRLRRHAAEAFVEHFLEVGYLELQAGDRVKVTEAGRLESLKFLGAGDR